MVRAELRRRSALRRAAFRRLPCPFRDDYTGGDRISTKAPQYLYLGTFDAQGRLIHHAPPPAPSERPRACARLVRVPAEVEYGAALLPRDLASRAWTLLTEINR